jgi:two-component system LytT family response regulator
VLQGEATAATRMLAQIGELLRTTLDNDASAEIPLRTGSRIQVVLADDIEWIAAAGDYVELHCGGRHHLLRETMNSLEQKLDPAKFLRIHRSRIVPVTCVRELRAMDNREYLMKLSDGSEHRSSRSYADRLQDWLSPQER